LSTAAVKRVKAEILLLDVKREDVIVVDDEHNVVGMDS
jgi:hypothetical protein